MIVFEKLAVMVVLPSVSAMISNSEAPPSDNVIAATVVHTDAVDIEMVSENTTEPAAAQALAFPVRLRRHFSDPLPATVVNVLGWNNIHQGTFHPFSTGILMYLYTLFTCDCGSVEDGRLGDLETFANMLNALWVIVISLLVIMKGYGVGSEYPVDLTITILSLLLGFPFALHRKRTPQESLFKWTRLKQLTGVGTFVLGNAAIFFQLMRPWLLLWLYIFGASRVHDATYGTASGSGSWEDGNDTLLIEKQDKLLFGIPSHLVQYYLSLFSLCFMVIIKGLEPSYGETTKYDIVGSDYSGTEGYNATMWLIGFIYVMRYVNTFADHFKDCVKRYLSHEANQDSEAYAVLKKMDNHRMIARWISFFVNLVMCITIWSRYLPGISNAGAAPFFLMLFFVPTGWLPNLEEFDDLRPPTVARTDESDDIPLAEAASPTTQVAVDMQSGSV